MIAISELSAEIFLIRSDIEVKGEDLLQVPEIKTLIGYANFELKLGDHDIWILRINCKL